MGTEATQETAEAARQLSENIRQLHPNVILETVEGWIPSLIGFGFHLLAAAAILLIGSRIIKGIRRLLVRTFERAGVEPNLSWFLASVANVLLYGILIFIAAEEIGISSASIIALLGSAGIAIGLALQGSLANFAGGVLILVMKPFKPGDYIITSGGEGTVQNIGLVYTTLTTIDNRKIMIPNGSLSDAPLTNVTGMDKRRIDLAVGIGYSSDLRLAKSIFQEILESHPKVLKEDPIQVFVKELGESAVILEGRAWTETEDYWPARWDITEAVKLAFDEAGIQIPFAQMDVHVVEEKGQSSVK